MAFTAQDVKALREATECGMLDCKKALIETDGDMEKAIDYLREKGIAKKLSSSFVKKDLQPLQRKPPESLPRVLS